MNLTYLESTTYSLESRIKPLEKRTTLFLTVEALTFSFNPLTPSQAIEEEKRSHKLSQTLGVALVSSCCKERFVTPKESPYASLFPPSIFAKQPDKREILACAACGSHMLQLPKPWGGDDEELTFMDWVFSDLHDVFDSQLWAQVTWDRMQVLSAPFATAEVDSLGIESYRAWVEKFVRLNTNQFLTSTEVLLP